MAALTTESIVSDPEDLGGRTARAAQWRVAGAAISGAFQFGIGVLLARLLTPEDFGVVGLAFVILQLTHPLADLGLGAAVVQRTRLTERDVRAAFTASVFLGLALATIIAIAAPVGAGVMRNAMVTPILRALALGAALRGVGVVAEALLRRKLDFKSQFFIDVGSYAVAYGIVAAAMALRGYGAWSLVTGALLQQLIVSLAQLAMVRHSFRPLLAMSELRGLLGFGLGSTANAWVNYVALNGDNFVVGRWLGPASLGLYSRAYMLMNIPYTYGASVMTSVLFPVFARLQNEPVRLGRAYLMMTQLSAIVAAPSMGLLAIAAPHLIFSLYGSRWEGVVVPLQILCAAGYLRALYHLGGVVAASRGWVYRELWRQVIYASLVVCGSMIGTRYGLPGIAAGVSVAILYMFIATGQLALRATGISWRNYFAVQRIPLTTAALTCGAGMAMRFALERLQFGSGIITLGVFLAAAIPWGLGILWCLNQPGLEMVLPSSVMRLALFVRHYRPWV